jgi:hypothetical protein
MIEDWNLKKEKKMNGIGINFFGPEKPRLLEYGLKNL